MSEAEDKHTPSAAAEDTAAADGAAAATKKGGSVVLLVIIVSLVWYLLADRYTPYTTQARVQGYVVGVAPKVAGVVTEVYVQNNQEVD